MITSVISEKGGVGKSTCAVNIAKALTRKGRKVGVLLLLAVKLIASAGTLFTVLFSIAAIIEICCLIFQPEKYAFSGNTPLNVLMLLGILYAVCFILSLLPTVVEKAFGGKDYGA